jgi:tetratricopeptide (TPR) repeat protein
MNHFGVAAQRGGDLAVAGRYFDLAFRINPSNPAALVNRNTNRNLASGKKPDAKPDEEVVDRLKLYGGRWDVIMGQNGPVDDPVACYALARVFEQGNNFRQAAQNIERTIALDPDNRNARLISAMICVKAMRPDIALEKITDFRKRYGGSNITELEEMELLRAEAWAHVIKGDLPTSERLLRTAQSKYPQETAPWETLFDIYNQLGQMTNAVTILDRQLQAQPNSSRALINYAAVKGRLGKAEDGLPYLDRALEINPKDDAARYNRAFTYQSMGRHDEAIQDYKALLDAGTSTYRIPVLYGIAETYFAKKNRRESLRYYNDFLKAAPPGMLEVIAVKERVKILESGADF